MSADHHKPNLSRALLTGVVGGLCASFMMDRFQALTASFRDDDAGGRAEPATEQVAERVAIATTGEPVAEAKRPAAGTAVHYVVGVGLGVAYAVAAEYEPRVTLGHGGAFGLVTAVLLDETAVPLAGLSKAPWTFPASVHIDSVASHLVFAATTEAVRRTARAL